MKGILRQAFKIFLLAIVVLVIAALGLWYWYVPGKQEPPYNMVMSWGLEGSQPGHFKDPIGIAVTKNEVYVADSKNDRIQVYTHNGHFKRQFGTHGSKPGELKRPMNISYRKGKLYVPEYYNQRVQVFDQSGKSLNIIKLNKYMKNPYPSSAQVGPLGNIYVSIFNHQMVLQLSPNGEKLGHFGHQDEEGYESNHFHFPLDVSLDDENYKYVVDGLGNRIQIYDKDGHYLTKWGGMFANGTPSRMNGWFHLPSAIAIGPEGNVFISDSVNNRVQKFSPQGDFLTAFGAKGRGQNKLSHPVGIDVDQNGDVYVVDYGHQRVTKWRPKLNSMNDDAAM